jgi:hypothetical protein
MLDLTRHVTLALGGMREHTISFLIFTAAEPPLEDAIPAPIGSEDEPILPICVGVRR